jgi:parvulin-like peptidyl-prolyl isomerase
MKAVIIDQIAIVVGNWIVKDSDIDRDVRATDFLNNQPLNLSEAARKDAANRLIDQLFIRHEIYVGDYPTATPEEADQQIARLQKQKFRTETAFEQALKRYGLSDAELRTQFQWHLTVLRFIAARFKPAVLVTDSEIDKYYREHRAALQRQYPGKSPNDLRDTIRDITGESVNKLFFTWLDEQRKDSKITYMERGLA